jgi:hypothetical protein
MTPQDTETLVRLHAEACNAYQRGSREPSKLIGSDDLRLLHRFGIDAQFLYDCVDDLARYGEPDGKTFLALADIRSAYFHDVLHSAPPPPVVNECELPPKSEAFDGIAWLPRIIRKARCFLDGCLCPEIMYGCAGDRAFLAKHGKTLPAFLKQVRDTKGDPAQLASFLRA